MMAWFIWPPNFFIWLNIFIKLYKSLHFNLGKKNRHEFCTKRHCSADCGSSMGISIFAVIVDRTVAVSLLNFVLTTVAK